MYKLLKWVYELGYKHAENKLYHQLHKAIDKPSDLEMFGFEDKPSYDKKQLETRLELSHRLHNLIEDVFRPETMMTVEQIEKNRFEL